MRRYFYLLLAFVAQTALASPMGTDDARHLLNRTTFGPTVAEVAEFGRLSRQEAVESLLAATSPDPVKPTADDLSEYVRPARLRDASGEGRDRLQKELHRRGIELRAWWLAEMLAAPTPATALRERMTLFWHNHFVSSEQKVKSTKLMLDQNLLLRRYAVGNFGTMLHAIGKDPAMVVYLDSATNRKEQPNENFAREVMELFTLGEGNYSEADIKEAARAFTGWSIEPDTGAYRWRPFIHDYGTKTLLGRSGQFDGDDVLDILLARPETAEFIVGKLWREFVSPTPDRAEVVRIAGAFRASGYEIKVALRELLLSPAFWAPANRLALIKSPVDLVVGTWRTAQLPTADLGPAVHALRAMGQDLFAPPNVKGWPGGETWINANTLLLRKQFLERISQTPRFIVPGREVMLDPAYQLK
jgi:uncharacterized protein (DUF1800 family)